MPSEKGGGGGKSGKSGGTIPKSDSTSSATTIEPSTPSTIEPATPSTSETQPLLAGSNSGDAPGKDDSLSRQVRELDCLTQRRSSRIPDTYFYEHFDALIFKWGAKIHVKYVALKQFSQ